MRLAKSIAFWGVAFAVHCALCFGSRHLGHAIGRFLSP